jgi:cytochrome c553
MVTGTSARIGALIAFVACGALECADAVASAESVDRATQTALSLDAHPERGGAQFGRYCAICHGSQAQGDAGTGIPALAGQRFAYLVRQLANFVGEERYSGTMRAVVSQTELCDPQMWVDIAAIAATHMAIEMVSCPRSGTSTITT